MQPRTPRCHNPVVTTVAHPAPLRSILTFVCFAAVATWAACGGEPAAATTQEPTTAAPAVEEVSRPQLSLGVVPQQSASKLAAQWGPLLVLVGDRAGVDLVFETATDIPTFEQRCRDGQYDIAYMNPYHYTVFHAHGYEALAKRKGSQIKGILVKKRGAPLSNLADLDGMNLAFPAPRAFAATMLTKAGLQAEGVSFTPHYVKSHDSVYRTVASGAYAAGGGIMRTFRSVAPDVREQLEVLWETPGYTPHAFAVHQRVPATLRQRILDALTSLAEDAEGRALLKPLRIPGIGPASDSDWDDVRALKIKDR